MLLVDGVYVSDGRRARFHRVEAADAAEMRNLTSVERIHERIGAYLERTGLPRAPSSYLALDVEPWDEDGLARQNFRYLR
jgi:hypothetical protein